MTQSGQGEEPSARPAREGIVLPSDGGEPLIPGLTATSGPQPGRHQGGQPGPYGAQPYGQQQPAQPPTGGQTWGQPWGPDQQAPAGQPEQGWPLPVDQQPQQWGAAQPDAWGAGPLPPEGAPAHTYGQNAPAAPQPSYDQSAPPVAPQPSYDQSAPVAPQPSYDPSPQDHSAYAYGQNPQVSAAPPTYPQGGPGAPMPPILNGAAGAAGADGATQYIPPVPAGPVDDGRTQMLPPIPAAGPVPGGDEGATQYIPPVRPGALPPESPAESTHFLGTGGHGAGPMAGAAHSDAEATQYIPPVPAQGHPAAAGGAQPPAGFENLFRDGPGGHGAPAGATQQLPRITEPETPGYGGGPHGYGGAPAARAPQPTYVPPVRPDDHGDERGRGGRTGSRLPLFAAVGVAIAVVGIGAGALLGGGGGDDDKGDGSTTVAASASASASSDPSGDAAEQQATALDKLLADSGSSRASVIAAVANVKACNNLGQAASDLRAAAGQRTELVTKLAALDVDQLPDHAALTGALTKAWQASAAADNHYADWADEVAGDKRKACKKGGARTTAATQQGNRESGTASAQKNQAARLWNGIAQKYGLTQRQPTQL
ncbi:hypothetical protein ABZ464_11420 [Streptomyces sp. NPDC005820]|uniref:hypothetical protein n=1 Tax=Streptomyces sp. NPDC005820 TaxID=3157069 RepID=UPI0033C85C81